MHILQKPTSGVTVIIINVMVIILVIERMKSNVRESLSHSRIDLHRMDDGYFTL